MKVIAVSIVALIFSLHAHAQNVGIGTATPTEKLEVNGNVKLQGLSLLEFGGNVSGKELNAGKIGYNAFGTNALAIVGAGTNTTNRAVYFFAEGGTTFSGPVTINGALRMAGNQGVDGQVLTSSGSGSPQWKNAAYSNNTRFSTSFSASGSSTSMNYTTRYNLNPTDITINANSITFNKSGLYHLEGFYRFSASYSAAYTGSSAPSVTTFIDATSTYYISENLELSSKTYYVSVFPFFSTQQPFNYDIHIASGTTITFSRLFTGQTTNGTFSTIGNLSGYLISE